VSVEAGVEVVTILMSSPVTIWNCIRPFFFIYFCQTEGGGGAGECLLRTTAKTTEERYSRGTGIVEDGRGTSFYSGMVIVWFTLRESYSQRLFRMYP
jgi:hypothetical protein